MSVPVKVTSNVLPALPPQGDIVKIRGFGNCDPASGGCAGDTLSSPCSNANAASATLARYERMDRFPCLEEWRGLNRCAGLENCGRSARDRGNRLTRLAVL